MSELIIIAPHPDDELIGCWEVLKKEEKSPIIIYTEDVNDKRREETLELKKHYTIKAQFFLKSIPPNLLQPENTFYFPDPIYETHPAHRVQGSVGESLARSGLDVIFYSTNMTAPYIHEIKIPLKELFAQKNTYLNPKEEILNEVYPSQKDLWKHEKKYILFEGRCKWIF